MRNGSNRAVLVVELLAQDGPYVAVAEDFVAGRCSRCASDTGADMHFMSDGFLCGQCARGLAH